MTDEVLMAANRFVKSELAEVDLLKCRKAGQYNAKVVVGIRNVEPDMLTGPSQEQRREIAHGIIDELQSG